jgi:flagellar protein FliJ
MSKYTFRLQSVENVRAAHRDLARAALAEAYYAERVLVENQTSIAAEQSELLTLQRSSASGENFDLRRLSDAHQYAGVLRSQQHELERQETLLQVEIERRRRTLVEAEREVRVLELLDKRHRAVHAREVRRHEVKEADEVAARMSSRSKRRPT